jgi:7-keto-8-aminopelargonate synthetase-like enzyme
MTAMHDWLAHAADLRERRGIIRHVDRVGTGRGLTIDLASNDYLGLATDPRLKTTAIRAIERDGTGARASRVVTGTVGAHLELERELCELTGQQAALVFSSGYLANLGVPTALGRPGALILTDGHAHASLIDAAPLSRATVETFGHGDLAALAARWRTAPPSGRSWSSSRSNRCSAMPATSPAPLPCARSMTRCSSSTKHTASASPATAGAAYTPLGWPGPSTSC